MRSKWESLCPGLRVGVRQAVLGAGCGPFGVGGRPDTIAQSGLEDGKRQDSSLEVLQDIKLILSMKGRPTWSVPPIVCCSGPSLSLRGDASGL